MWCTGISILDSHDHENGSCRLCCLPYVCVSRARVCLCVCVRACMRLCIYVHVCVCVCVYANALLIMKTFNLHVANV